MDLMGRCVVSRVEGSVLGWFLAGWEDGLVVVDCHCLEVIFDSEELRDLAELAVAAVGTVEVAVHRDDTLRTRHLEHEVGVVRYRHESGEGWAPEYRVVLRLPVDYLEVDRLPLEVFGCAEDDIECDRSHGRDCLPWYYAMEGGL